MRKNPVPGNQGFILMTTLMVGTILTVLSGAYFAASLSQSNIARRQFEASQEFYNAEAGMAYLYLEAKNGNTLTHSIIDPATGELGVGLSGTRQFSSAIVAIDTDGTMVIKRGGKSVAKGKIYQKDADTIILVRAVDANGNEVGPVHRYLTSHKSLYKYFQFYDNGSPDPGNYRWNPGSNRYLGKLIDGTMKVGGIHVNGDISLDKSGFINLSELSASRDFYYSYEPNYDTLWPQEPSKWDYSRYDNFARMVYSYYNKSSCAGCWIDGLALLPRFGPYQWNFQYPLPVDVLGLGQGGTYREVFHHPNFWVYGSDFTDDWKGSNPPTAYGTSYFWMKDYDSNGNGSDSLVLADGDERKRIPKILINSGGDYNKDMYRGEPGDNRVLVPPEFMTLSTSAPPNCTEPPVRFEVVGTIATISNPAGVDPTTGLAYKYDALRWLADKEDAKGEYLTIYSNWLTTTVSTNAASGCSGAALTNDGNWDKCEYDRVTLLSIEAEGVAATGTTAGLALGGGQGLDGSSEYTLYKAVKQYYLGGDGIRNGDAAEGTFPAGTTVVIQNWIKGLDSNGFPNFEPTNAALKAELTADFFFWWKSRKYHHKESLTDCSTVSYDGNWCFASDKLTQTTDAYGNVSKAVPAWERLFWEAWLNYWPPASNARLPKKHNEVYTPASIFHAINPEWWEDLIAGTGRPNSGPDQTMSVPYFNTANNTQADAFATWLADPSRNLYNSADPASSIVKFRNHAGEYLNPLNIKEKYSSLAQNYGLYIKQNPDNSFSAKLNGSLLADNQSLANCLSSLGTWISEKTFYNPYTITRSKVSSDNSTYNPSLYDPAETDKSKATSIDPFLQIYGVDYCPSTTAESLPPPVKVIEIDLSQLKSDVTLTRPIIYIESVDYDTRLVNGYSLPAGNGTLENPGGFTLVSPYDVYVKAKKVSGRGYFNYEAADKTLSSQGLDTNFRPAAVITNSRVYLLSSEFKDMSVTFPYSYNFPRQPAVAENTFLQTYCYPSDSFSPAKPDASLYTTTWVNAHRTSAQLITLSNNGEAAYDAAFGPSSLINGEVNIVKYNQYFNLAIASPFEPRGYRLERWASNEAHTTNIPIFLEGAFIKTGLWKNSDNTFVLSRYHTPLPGPLRRVIGCYEGRRFNINGSSAESLKVYNNLPTASATYEYEERFFDPYQRPAGDFLASGSQRRWDQLSGADAFNNDTPS